MTIVPLLLQSEAVHHNRKCKRSLGRPIWIVQAAEDTCLHFPELLLAAHPNEATHDLSEAHPGRGPFSGSSTLMGIVKVKKPHNTDILFSEQKHRNHNVLPNSLFYDSIPYTYHFEKTHGMIPGWPLISILKLPFCALALWPLPYKKFYLCSWILVGALNKLC